MLIWAIYLKMSQGLKITYIIVQIDGGKGVFEDG